MEGNIAHVTQTGRRWGGSGMGEVWRMRRVSGGRGTLVGPKGGHGICRR